MKALSPKTELIWPNAQCPIPYDLATWLETHFDAASLSQQSPARQKRPVVESGCNDIYYNFNSFLRISYKGFKPI